MLGPVLGGCSSGPTASSGPSGSAGTAASAPRDPQSAWAAWRPPACHRPPPPPVVAAAVPGVGSDWTVTSFDGTLLRAHWFPLPGATAAHPAPTVLMGPGWSEPGDTDLSGTGDLFGTVSIPDLQRAGYNVLTWDPRGFGKSTGTVEIDSPYYEARDVSRLVDWVATRAGAQLDAPGDPRVGMVGGSYGGGIQWVTAATDCRVDAITPTISWHSLLTSLDKSGIAKIGWANVLYAAAAGDSLDPHIRSAAAQANATGQVDPSDAAWFAARGPGPLVTRVRVPTLVVQGTVDTLFTLDEGILNYRAVRAQGVPVAMLWYCGGHGVCLTRQGDPAAVERATIGWLDRWVKRQASAAVGPPVDLVDQDGVRYSAANYPVPTSAVLSGAGHGTLPLVAAGGSGPVAGRRPTTLSSAALAGIALGILPAPARTAVDVPVGSPRHAGLLVGAPVLSLTYRGTASPGARPTRIFAQVVDDSTGLVVGSQVTPVPVVLDGSTHHLRAPLETICQSVRPGQHLTVQLVATTVAYATPRLGGSVDVLRATVALPLAAPSAVRVERTP